MSIISPNIKTCLPALVAAILIANPSVAVSAPPKKAAPTGKARPVGPPASAITPADIRAAGVAVGFDIKGDRVVNACDEPVQPPEQNDINGDGQKELVFGDGACTGGMAGWFGIARKLPTGKWVNILDTQGVFEILPTRHGGWPDIQTGGPGCTRIDPRYSFRNGKYEVSGGRPQRCTSGDAILPRALRLRGHATEVQS